MLLRVVLIGESGVGKTAIMKQYVNGEFSQFYKSTVGADFFTKELEIDDTIYTLQLWDTAGQERYKSLGQSFYRGVDICIIVYDVKDESWLEQVEEWKNRFYEQSEIETCQQRLFPMFLLGNKQDLLTLSLVYGYWRKYGNCVQILDIINICHEYCGCMDPDVDIILHKEGKEYAESNDMLYWEVSAKTGYNVDGAFIGIIRGWNNAWQQIRHGFWFHKSDWCTDLGCDCHKENPEWDWLGLNQDLELVDDTNSNPNGYSCGC